MLPLRDRVDTRNHGNEGVLRIPQNYSITGVSLSYCLVSKTGRSFGESYSSAEMQLVYSAASADRSMII